MPSSLPPGLGPALTYFGAKADILIVETVPPDGVERIGRAGDLVVVDVDRVSCRIVNSHLPIGRIVKQVEKERIVIELTKLIAADELRPRTGGHRDCLGRRIGSKDAGRERVRIIRTLNNRIAVSVVKGGRAIQVGEGGDKLHFIVWPIVRPVSIASCELIPASLPNDAVTSSMTPPVVVPPLPNVGILSALS